MCACVCVCLGYGSGLGGASKLGMSGGTLGGSLGMSNAAAVSQ